MKIYAPIIIFAYNREKHLQKVIEALEKNREFASSELYIFVDGKKNETDGRAVQAVWDFLDEYLLKGRCKAIHVFKEKENKGLASSIISGVTKVFEDYENAIILEDDIIVSSYFLKYMNDALNFYKNDSQIWSITGYTPPLKCLNTYPKDVYATRRFCSWGWGIWKERWEKIDWNVSDYDAFISSRRRQKAFAKGGQDLPIMLKMQMNGEIDSWAIRCSYGQFSNMTYTIAPRVSMVNNIGHDGSGTHCSLSSRFDNVMEAYDKVLKLEELPISKKIDRAMCDFWSNSWYAAFKLRLVHLKARVKNVKER